MYKHLYLSGGGILTLSYLGALISIEEERCVCEQHDLTGSSAGAIIAFLLNIGYTTKELIHIIFNNNALSTFLKFNNNFEKIDNVLDNSELFVFLDTLCTQKEIHFDTLTFDILYDHTHQLLSISGTSIKTSSCKLFNKETTPSMLIKTALCITTCIPVFFLPIEYDNDLWIDGSICFNIDHRRNDTLNVISELSFTNLTCLKTLYQSCNNDCIYYFLYMHVLFLNMLFKKTNKYNKNSIIIDHEFSLMINTNDLSKEKVFDMLINGYTKSKTFFKKNN